MINYIMLSDGKLILGFSSAQDAVAFLAAQSGNIGWQAQFEVTRVFAYGKFHWTATASSPVTINFVPSPL